MRAANVGVNGCFSSGGFGVQRLFGERRVIRNQTEPESLRVGIVLDDADAPYEMMDSTKVFDGNALAVAVVLHPGRFPTPTPPTPDEERSAEVQVADHGDPGAEQAPAETGVRAE